MLFSIGIYITFFSLINDHNFIKFNDFLNKYLNRYHQMCRCNKFNVIIIQTERLIYFVICHLIIFCNLVKRNIN